VQLESGNWKATVKPAFLDPQRLEIALPLDTPAGELSIAVENGQGRSRAEKVMVTGSAQSIVSLNGEGWGPVQTGPAAPGGRVTLTLNGKIAGHPKIFIAGVEARSLRIQGHQIIATLPAKVPEGCWVPLWLESETGDLSNFVTVEVRNSKLPCKDLPAWFAPRLPAGTNSAQVLLARISGQMEGAGGNPQDFAFESAAAFFVRTGTAKLQAIQAMPPAGTCATYTATFSLDTAGAAVQSVIGSFEKLLDAGSSIAIRSPDARESKIAPAPTPGIYAGLLGGLPPMTRGKGLAPFLTPGLYTIDGAGAADIPKFSLPIPVPPSFEWLNREEIAEVDRKTGAELRWRDAAPNRQMVAILFSVDQDTSASGTAICVAPPGAPSLRIPPYALANFPATQPTRSIIPFRFLILISIPASPPAAKIPGVQNARGSFLEIQARSVRFR
jgi:hypothetical protein